MIQWDYLKDGYKCPVCNKEFKSDACPHSWADVEMRNFDNYVKALKERPGGAGK